MVCNGFVVSDGVEIYGISCQIEVSCVGLGMNIPFVFLRRVVNGPAKSASVREFSIADPPANGELCLG